jgi:hypothetical protein
MTTQNCVLTGSDPIGLVMSMELSRFYHRKTCKNRSLDKKPRSSRLLSPIGCPFSQRTLSFLRDPQDLEVGSVAGRDRHGVDPNSGFFRVGTKKGPELVEVPRYVEDKAAFYKNLLFLICLPAETRLTSHTRVSRSGPV